MARYRKIDTRIWNDEKFRAFSDDAQLAFFFVLTHPSMTALGAMRGTIAGLAAEKGWQVGRFADAIQDTIREGMLEVNEKACFIAARNFLRYNEPEGPNSVSKAWVQALDLIPECPEKWMLIARCRSYLDTRSKKFRDAMPDGIWNVFKDAMSDGKSDASPIPEQEPDQEPDIKTSSSEPQICSDQMSGPPQKKTATEPSRGARGLAALLKSEIQRNKADYRITRAQERKWSATAQRMLEIDRRDPEEIADLIHWVQRDEFWMANVLSMDTLRSKFDQLQLKRKNSGGNGSDRRPRASRAEGSGCGRGLAE